ncbi:MAG: cytochrome c biogenesis protein CcsA [Alistipes sp.]|jgi:ABC-type transport system involved in cytochrome c biogenesis permease subunit|nr:cytochrome c biogenesis protein CcsA [Alistipes sp.]
MDWSNFAWFAVPSVALWLSAGAAVYRKSTSKNDRLTQWLMASGITLFALFIVGFWITLDRPPMRTAGETRLWYSLFLSVVGFVGWRRWRYPWLLSYSSVVATVFVLVNILKPEIHSKNLMPALQSIWFVPHVTSYILSYAMLGAATIGAFIGLRRLDRTGTTDRGVATLIDNLVYAGFGLLVLGMLMGAVWAKQAWGHYWEWDPKETWALVTALAYLVYIHLRFTGPRYARAALWLLPIAFALLMITWVGVNYLPSAQSSIHVY